MGVVNPLVRPVRRTSAVVAALLTGALASGCTSGVANPAVPPGTEPASSSTAVVSPTASASSAATVRPSTRPATAPGLRIGSVSNFRDVAGAGLELPDGHRMVTGLVYRSAKLATASSGDIGRLKKAGVDLVIDLRTNDVASRSPDPAIPGADHLLVNIYAVTRSPTTTYRSVAAARAHMRQLNIDFVDKRAQRDRIAEALTLIASADGPVIVHCTEGKDRTGWISAMLQLVAGADRRQVLAEYLKSNEYRAELLNSRYAATKRARGTVAAQTEHALLAVDASYLGAGLDEMDQRYGGLDGYLTDGLGLSQAIVAKLRALLVAA